MAFRKVAKALLTTKKFEIDKWMEEIRRPYAGIEEKTEHGRRFAKTLIRKCNPKQYLLSHATIVASVDTYEPKSVKLGKQLNQGIEIDVKFGDYKVKPECHEIINNNHDFWSRPLLLSSYRTFVGAQNFVEHIQLAELSKGFIADAVARDLGNTVYIDILVATEKRHQKLIQDILSGEMSSLSMGCHLPGTRVTMSDGSVLPIEDVRPNMEVISQKGNACRVDNLQIRENRWSIRKIKISGLPVINSTDNHDYYVVPRSHLRFKNDRVEHLPYELEKLPAGSIEPGDIIATPILQSQTKPNVSLSEARFLGFWVGDGWKFENKHDLTVGVGLCCDVKYPDIADDIALIMDQICFLHMESLIQRNGSDLNSTFYSRTEFIQANSVHDRGSFTSFCKKAGVSRRTGYNWIREYQKHGGAFLKDPRKELKKTTRNQRRNAYYLTNSSKSIRNLVDSHTQGRKALEKVIGSDVMSWPIDHQLAFMSGVIDSDGCVSSTKGGTSQVFISSRNENLINQYQMILARCGIISTISAVNRAGTKMLPNSSGIDYQIRIRNDGALKIPSKKIKRCADKIRYTPGNYDRWITDKYLYARVKSVESYDYEGFVYDLQVDNDHSYIANGVGVSNCLSLFTICNRCGNVAADDSTLCPCILYLGKGSKFADEDGVEHPLAEQVGHISVPNSNTFIEASWVKNPAFKGAVSRNLLNPDEISDTQLASSRSIFEMRSALPVPNGIGIAASMKRRAQDEPAAEEPAAEEPKAEEKAADEDLTSEFDKVGDAPADEGGGEEPKAEAEGGDEAKADKAPGFSEEKIDGLIDQIQESIVEAIANRIKEKLGPQPEDVGYAEIPSASGGLEMYNSNFGLGAFNEFSKKLRKTFSNNKKLVNWAERNYKIVHGGGRRAIRANHVTSRDLILLSWIEDRLKVGTNSQSISKLYKIAIAAGPLSLYPSTKSYLTTCSVKLGRKLSPKEETFFLWKGKIASISLMN